uniref:SusD/RagB family nutrient-binding outer membrane lipoprotein n=1 Tax=Roseihalotalea indica TaxID=2867963 RepID=A0AA49GUB6_9BACT|nr:SusD/RagB family nutrient-binding outer membrane lipoprotein [Tunicatimonas sp. TK19036]
MKNILSILSTAVLLLVASSCGEDWLDVNTDPNNPTDPDLDLLVPAAQLGITQPLIHENGRLGDVQALGHNAEGTISQYQFTGSDFNNAWNDFFTLSLVNLNKIIDDAAEQELPAYGAIAKLHKAYVYVVIADMWSTAPYDEAVVGAEGPDNPQFQDGETIYNSVLSLIDEALATLGGLPDDALVPATDIIYDGNVDSWVRMGNTLKLKMYINLAMLEGRRAEAVAAINQLAQSGNLIEDYSQDFQLQYGAGLAPENRHRWHQTHYQGNKTYYMSNFMMNRMKNEYGIVDPRIRYYFYRQIGEFSDALGTGRVVPDDFPCYGFGARPDLEETWTATCPIGYVGDGYTGRDHGDGTGGPNDGGSRTTYGVYPVMGLFDDNSGKIVTQSDGTGAGVVPMLTSYMTKFYLAEAALLYNTDGDPRTLLQEGIEQSINKVMDFGRNNATNYDAALEPTETNVAEYMARILELYDAAQPDAYHASVAEAQLDVIMGQFQLANFGNPIESYNNLRRTKYPYVPVGKNNIQAMSIIPNNKFPRRLPLPQDEVNTNTNAPRPSDIDWRRDPVFWDTKPYPARFDGNL